ncbi:unnamed protein product, partial [Vitrella brassicaformis CCMP3155]
MPMHHHYAHKAMTTEQQPTNQRTWRSQQPQAQRPSACRPDIAGLYRAKAATQKGWLDSLNGALKSRYATIKCPLLCCQTHGSAPSAPHFPAAPQGASAPRPPIWRPGPPDRWYFSSRDFSITDVQFTGRYFFSSRSVQLRGVIDGRDCIVRFLVPDELRRHRGEKPLRGHELLMWTRLIEDESKLLHRLGSQLRGPALLARGFVSPNDPLTLTVLPPKDKTSSFRDEEEAAGETTTLKLSGPYFAVETLKLDSEDAPSLGEVTAARAALNAARNTNTPLEPPLLYGPGGGQKLKPSLMAAVAGTTRRAIHEALLHTLTLARDLQQPFTCPPLSTETAVPAAPLSPSLRAEWLLEKPAVPCKAPTLWRREGGSMRLLHGDMHPD